MYGEFNKDRFCQVIEQILNERNKNIEYKVFLIDKDQKEDDDSEQRKIIKDNK
jgi:hypothetical protein